MRSSTLGLSFLLILAVSGACGGGGGANITIGTMPEGGTFQGVWQSPQYGNMHLCQTGTSVNGDYEKDERHGTIQGTVQGDVLRFQWEERRELVAGRPTVTRGRGYWKLEIGGDGDTYIKGEWGVDDSEVGGGEWNGVKMRRGNPERCLRGGSGSTGGDDGYDDGGGYEDEGSYEDEGTEEDNSNVDNNDLEGLDEPF